MSKWAMAGTCSLLNDEQMSDKVRVEYQPITNQLLLWNHLLCFCDFLLFLLLRCVLEKAHQAQLNTRTCFKCFGCFHIRDVEKWGCVNARGHPTFLRPFSLLVNTSMNEESMHPWNLAWKTMISCWFLWQISPSRRTSPETFLICSMYEVFVYILAWMQPYT